MIMPPNFNLMSSVTIGDEIIDWNVFGLTFMSFSSNQSVAILQSKRGFYETFCRVVDELDIELSSA